MDEYWRYVMRDGDGISSKQREALRAVYKAKGLGRYRIVISSRRHSNCASVPNSIGATFSVLAVVSLAGAALLSICFPVTDFCHYDDAASSKQTIEPRSTPASKPSLVPSWWGFQAHTPLDSSEPQFLICRSCTPPSSSSVLPM